MSANPDYKAYKVVVDDLPVAQKVMTYASIVDVQKTKGFDPHQIDVLTNCSVLKTSEGRADFIHTMSTALSNLGTVFDTTDPLKVDLILGAVDFYLKQSMYFSKIQGSPHSYACLKVLKSIIRP